MRSLDALDLITSDYVELTEKERYELINTIEKDLRKLDEYKKIEKEIGIDLITLFKAINEGFYRKVYCSSNEYRIEFTPTNNLCLSYAIDENEKRYYRFSSPFFEYLENCYLLSYGEKWALTKEELE